MKNLLLFMLKTCVPTFHFNFKKRSIDHRIGKVINSRFTGQIGGRTSDVINIYILYIIKIKNFNK